MALAVANEVAKATVFGTDLSADAISLAKKNAKRLEIGVRFLRGDLFGALPRAIRGSVDVITLHPPYVAAHEIDDLPDEIREWEPVDTLTDHSNDGLGLLTRAAEEAPSWLRKNGWLLVEVDPDRARDVRRVLVGARYRDVRSTKGGELKVTRVVVGRPPV